MDSGNFWSAVVGGAIAGTFALLGVWFTHRLDLRKAKEATEQKVINLYQSVYDEIGSLWVDVSQYSQQYLNDRVRNPFLMSQVKFIIYENNSALVGQIPNSHIRHTMIQAYMYLSSLYEALFINNQLIFDVQSLEGRSYDGSSSGQSSGLTPAGRLDAYEQIIRELHERAAGPVERLLHLLVEHGVIANNNN